jgi:putative tricarboxylic transport membrane protein
MRTQRDADIVSGAVLSLMGLVIVLASFNITSAFGERLPPRFLPLMMGSIMMVTALLLVVRSLRCEPGPEVEWPDRSGWINIIVTFLSLAGYLLLIDPIGMPLATFAFLTFLIWYLDRGIVKALIIAAITSVVVLFVFIRWLELTLPVGPLNW